MTWATSTRDYDLNVTRVGCSGCDAYNGDYSCIK